MARAAGSSPPAPPFGRRLCEVTGRLQLGAYVLLEVLDREGPRPEPGQFYMLAAREGWGGGDDARPYLPRALSVARASGEGEAGRQLEFLLEAVGPGTARLSELRATEELWLAGPLGVGFGDPLGRERALLVGGGIGVAPLAGLQRSLIDAGIDQRALLGFRDAERVRGSELFQRPEVATDDGSIGFRGSAVDLLERELDRDGAARVYACGPAAMLEAVRALCGRRETPCQLALEAGMACGFGACFGCVVATRHGYARVCLDGPVFAGEELDADWVH